MKNLSKNLKENRVYFLLLPLPPSSEGGFLYLKVKKQYKAIINGFILRSERLSDPVWYYGVKFSIDISDLI